MVIIFPNMWPKILPHMLIGRGMNMFMAIILKCKQWVKCTIVQWKCSAIQLVSESQKKLILNQTVVFNHTQMKIKYKSTDYRILYLWRKVMRVCKQKWLLLFILKEAYAFFKQYHPDTKLGFSEFCKLWPKYVQSH